MFQVKLICNLTLSVILIPETFDKLMMIDTRTGDGLHLINQSEGILFPSKTAATSDQVLKLTTHQDRSDQ